MDTHKLTKVLRITRAGIVCENLENGEQMTIPADTVVLAIGSRADNHLSEALADKVKKLTVIGDAVKPRKVMDAIRDAYDAAVACEASVSINV